MGFGERFPRWTSAVLVIAQAALTAAIIGLEIGSSYIDLAHGTVWIGFWAGIVFIKTILVMLFISTLHLIDFFSFLLLIHHEKEKKRKEKTFSFY
jgi:hypothetical protein